MRLSGTVAHMHLARGYVIMRERIDNGQQPRSMQTAESGSVEVRSAPTR